MGRKSVIESKGFSATLPKPSGPPEKGNAVPAGPRNGAERSKKASNLRLSEYLAARWGATKTVWIFPGDDGAVVAYSLAQVLTAFACWRCLEGDAAALIAGGAR